MILLADFYPSTYDFFVSELVNIYPSTYDFFVSELVNIDFELVERLSFPRLLKGSDCLHRTPIGIHAMR